MKNKIRYITKKTAITAILFFLSINLFARDVTVTVMDIDLDYPLEGAVIRTRDGIEYVCDENGRAVIIAPDTRQIIINAHYPGYETGVMTIPVTGNSFIFYLSLSGILQGSELVIEAPMPGTNETRTGRSISVGSREISQTGEIGIVEDVMSTIKLLPGVNYSGMFNAQPSIRGGYPGDMSASFDGFIVQNPYFWGGGVSIFDPRMVQSAQLSHGVFSARFGHTISGLLEITAKKPSPTQTLFELGVNTSAANFSLSLPLNKGGIIFMGRITYYDPVIRIAQNLSDEIPALDVVNYIHKAPYIGTAAVNGNYRFTDTLELSAAVFFGADGVGVDFENSNNTINLVSLSSANFDYANYQGFITASLTWNPRLDMLLKFTAGTGFETGNIKGDINYEISEMNFSSPIAILLSDYIDKLNDNNGDILDPDKYKYYEHNKIDQSDTLINLQARMDFDWELSEYFLLSAGLQEMFSFSKTNGIQRMLYDTNFDDLTDITIKEKIIDLFNPLPIPFDPNPIQYPLIVGMPVEYSPDSKNHLLTTSLYALGEFYLNKNRIKGEIGVRLDHFALFGDGFILNSEAVFNPRLILDFNIFKNKGFINSFDISAGTGLFSSVDSAVFDAEKDYNLDQIKPNRSWTSVLGFRFEFQKDLTLNIEGYYKYIFDRMYVSVDTGSINPAVKPYFDGIGHVWGIDVMLHKIQSRYWDGWLSYSFNWAKYLDPYGEYGGMGISGGNRGDSWYFPYFHRFHNLNLVFNYKPAPFLNIYFRFGIASGIPLSKRTGSGPVSYPVLVYDKDDIDKSYFIEKYYWRSVLDPDNRTTPSLPFDIKVSFFGGNQYGKTRWELYFALENILALVYKAKGNTSFNQYTGQVDSGSNSANYEIPIPVPSFGFKISY